MVLSTLPSLSLLIILSIITTKRQVIHDITASRFVWNERYDFIIVGAGTAGCVVANRLAARGVSVLLLEAGGAQDAIYTDIPFQWLAITPERPDLQWSYTDEPQSNAGLQFPGGRMPQTTGKVIGGSSSHNGMIFNRGNSRDFDEWEQKYGAKGWSYKEVLPYFKKFERNTDPKILAMSPGYHGTDGPVEITSPKDPGESLLKLKNVFNSLGFADTDINGRNQTGTMIYQSYIGLNGFRSSSGTAYVDPNPYPFNLHIVTKAMVTKILFNGLTATGVEFVKNNNTYRICAQKEVIISAGPIRSPQLLMLSGVGPKTHLQDFNIPVVIDLPVGDNFKNKPWINSIPFSTGELPITQESLRDLYFYRRGRLSQFPVLVNYFNTTSNDNAEWPNAMMYSVPNPFNTTQLFTFVDLVRVRSIGSIRLQSTDPHIQPVITTNMLSDPQDFEDAVDATKFLFYLWSLPSVAPYSIIPTFEDVNCPSCPGIEAHLCDVGIRCFVRYTSLQSDHPAGSCRMGAADRTDVVVDPLLRVKYAHNLRVCDSSVFPDLPNANTMAATLMVGEKCAQIIRDCYHF